MTVVIGVDPGAPMTMAMIGSGGRWVAHAGGDLLSIPARTGRTHAPDKIWEILSSWVRWAEEKRDQDVVAVIENVNPQPGEGVVSACKFMGSVWLMRGMFQAAGIPYVLTTPQEWKGHYQLPGGAKNKEASVRLARALFPYREWKLKYKKDHDYAEAALLARYHWLKIRDELNTGKV